MRDLSTGVQEQQTTDFTKPVDIYEMYLGSQTLIDDDTIFFVSHPDRLNFWDTESTRQLYIPLGVRRGPVAHNMELSADYYNVAYDNVDRAMSALIAQTDFRGKRVVLRIVFLDQVSSEDDATMVFDGIMDSPNFYQGVFSLRVTSRINLKIRSGRLYQLMCQWVFGGDQCVFERLGSKKSGTVNAGSTSSVILDSSRTEVSDYWKHGLLEITSGVLKGQKRRVTQYSLDSRQISLDITFESVPGHGVTYDVYRGCDKTLGWCQSLGNEANFGGFHTLPVEVPENL